MLTSENAGRPALSWGMWEVCVAWGDMLIVHPCNGIDDAFGWLDSYSKVPCIARLWTKDGSMPKAAVTRCYA